MKNKSAILILSIIALSGCSEGDRALVGGGAEIDTPRLIGALNGKEVYEVTCSLTNMTRCSLAAQQSCSSNFNVLERKPRTGYISGRPAQLMETTFQCS
jgi:hypothetical protein